jgi:hypothetical protein
MLSEAWSRSAPRMIVNDLRQLTGSIETKLDGVELWDVDNIRCYVYGTSLITGVPALVYS